MITFEASVQARTAFRRNLERAVEHEAVRRARAIIAGRKREGAHPWRSSRWLWPDLGEQ